MTSNPYNVKYAFLRRSRAKKNYDACVKLVGCIFNLLHFWGSCCCRRRRIFKVPESYLQLDTMNSPIKYQGLSRFSKIQLVVYY